MNFNYLNTYLKIIIIISFIIGSIVAIKNCNEESHRFDDYNYIGDIKDFNGIVISIKRNRGIAFLELSNCLKVSVTVAENDNYYPETFTKFINVGDSFSRISDTLLLYRNDSVYKFVLSKRIKKGTKP